MIIRGVTIQSDSIRLQSDGEGFQCLSTRVDPGQGGEFFSLRAEATSATVEWLAPFSWDAGLRGVLVRDRHLEVGQLIVLHAGPYGTADAVADSAEMTMMFPTSGDGHRYTADAEPSPDAIHQDAAGWAIIDLGDRCLVVAWDFSGTVTTTVSRTAEGVFVSARLPLDIGDSRIPSRGPDVWLAVVDGGLDAGAEALRTLITERFVIEPDLSGLPGTPEFPPLLANSWGVAENTSTSRILAMMDATAAIGAEVFVVDKGWERSVGDWHPNSRFTAPAGANSMAWLSDQARRRGMGFGVWCGFGNADPTSPVAIDHPDWVASWLGVVRPLSFDTLSLCLGHDPTRDWVLDQLRRMVTDFGLTWLIHDFETMARCDRPEHTHGVGGGDRAAESAWHHVLRTLRAEHPQLIIENCWNGGRPLDLAMIRSHHTTITEDHCRVHWNTLAKVAMGRYLPLDWQSAYMGTEDLPPRARIAPYVVGGPWVLMDDPDQWDPMTRATLGRAATIYKTWRRALRNARTSRPGVELLGQFAHGHSAVDAVQATLNDGRAILALRIPSGHSGVTLRPTGLSGLHAMTDEWTQVTTTVTITHDGLFIPVEPDGDGLILSFVPLA